MGRRYQLLAALTLAFGLGTRYAPAQQSDNALPPAADAAPAATPGAPIDKELPVIPAPAEAPGAAPGGPSEVPPPVEAGGSKSKPHGADPSQAPPPGEALPEPPAMPAAPAMPAPGAVKDPKVIPSQLPGPAAASPPAGRAGLDGESPLPPAIQRAGVPPSHAGRPDGGPFVLPSDQLPLGPQSIALSVEVLAPTTLNINQEATLRIIVKNTGNADARGVVVRDVLPQGLEFISSQPAEQRHASESLLFWNLNTVPAGSEQPITIRVKPTRVGQFDHAATVTMMAGSRARTLVREPKLKIEQVATPGRVLKGQPVRFDIAVVNTGDGPARNVRVRAKLSAGLNVASVGGDSDNMFEVDLGDIEQGRRVPLDPLEADAKEGGEQWCQVQVESPDVLPKLEGSTSIAKVFVTEPKLKMTIAGPDKRYTDTLASYEIVLENPGTATARNVQVMALMPNTGRPFEIKGARWDPSKRMLYWSFAQLEPGEKEKLTLPFQVKLGAPGFFTFRAEAKASTVSPEKGTMTTNVLGMADIDFEVTEPKRVIDVNDVTYYQIRITNRGSKEATKLLVTATLSPNLVAEGTINADDDPAKQAHQDKDRGLVVWPIIPRLAPNSDTKLYVRVRAVKDGLATCNVSVTHDDLGESRLGKVIATRVTTPVRR